MVSTTTTTLHDSPDHKPSFEGIKPHGKEDGKPVWCAIAFTKKFGTVLGKSFGPDLCYYSYGFEVYTTSNFIVYKGQQRSEKLVGPAVGAQNDPWGDHWCAH